MEKHLHPYSQPDLLKSKSAFPWYHSVGRMSHHRHADFARDGTTLQHMEALPAIPDRTLTPSGPTATLHHSHEASSSFPDQMPPRHGPAASKRVDELAARGLRRQDVDDDVQDALRRQHERGDIVEREVDAVRVDEGIHAVGGRGDPDDEHGEEEEEGDAGVQPGARVGVLLQGFLPRDGAHLEYFWFRGFAVAGVWADANLDGVRVWPAVAFFHARDALEGLVKGISSTICIGGWGDLVGRADGDIDFSGDDAGKGVFVEGIEETF